MTVATFTNHGDTRATTGCGLAYVHAVSTSRTPSTVDEEGTIRHSRCKSQNNVACTTSCSKQLVNNVGPVGPVQFAEQ